MLSVLLHLNDVQHGESVIEFGVGLAKRWEARVRGLTLLDTRHLTSQMTTCEAAVHASGEFQRLDNFEHQQGMVRTHLSHACLLAGVDFDVRRARGNPFDLLPPESQLHDLVVTAHRQPATTEDADQDWGLTANELVDLLFRGVQPMLVVRGKQQALNRVLLVYDGTPASGKAVRSFLNQNLLPDAEYRLLAVGDSKAQARQSLREMVEYCQPRRLSLETGLLCGSLRRQLIPFAEKWQADLIVLGVARGNRLLRRLLGETAQDILRKTEFALYATA